MFSPYRFQGMSSSRARMNPCSACSNAARAVLIFSRTSSDNSGESPSIASKLVLAR